MVFGEKSMTVQYCTVELVYSTIQHCQYCPKVWVGPVNQGITDISLYSDYKMSSGKYVYCDTVVEVTGTH